jgi:phosphoribosylpyrophosphate synthetase
MKAYIQLFTNTSFWTNHTTEEKNMQLTAQSLEQSGILIYCGSGNTILSDRMMKKLGENMGFSIPVEHINFGSFADGELNNKLPNYEKIKGKTIFFFQSIHTLELMEEFFELSWAMKHQYGASQIIAVVPFLRYRRQDRGQEKPHEINRLKMIIQRMSQNGIEQLITITPHSDQMRECCQDFGIEFQGLNVTSELTRAISAFLPISERNARVKVYAPDAGSIPRAIAVARRLEVGVLFDIKQRKDNNRIQIIDAEQEQIKSVIESYPELDIQYASEEYIQGSIIIMVEDEMASGETANTTGQRIKNSGARELFFIFTHPVCNDGWKDKLLHNNPFTKIFSFDTIPRGFKNRTGGKIRDVSAGDLLAATLYRSIQEKISHQA